MIALSVGVVLTCDDCQHIYEPSPGDWHAGLTDCERCGGRTTPGDLIEPGGKL